MRPHEVITELESDNSRKFKEAVIAREDQAGNTEFFEGVSMAMDKLRTFGLKQVPESTKDGKGLDWTTFADTASRLESRQLTGNAAREHVEHIMGFATQAEWNHWYRRILIKDLRCGVTEKTINKFSKMQVPVFECMLADDSKKHESKMKGKVYVEPKLDGVRVIAICDKEKNLVTLMSRNGKELVNFPHINTQFEHMLAELDQSWIFDGEVMSADFQTLMRQIHRKGDAKTEDAVLNLFDCMPLKDFAQGGCDKSLTERKKWLASFAFGDNITVVESINFDLDQEQDRFMAYNRQCIDQGYEGIMIKPQDGVYECRRSSLWLKVKPFIEVSLKIVDVEEGTGRNKGKLGALIVEGTDDGKFIKTNVGSGLTDEDRETFWKDTTKLIGKIVEVRADAITQNQDAVNEYSLRFPRFMRFRGFDKGEKI